MRYPVVTFLFGFLACGLVLPLAAGDARAQCDAHELAKLLAADGGSGDQFGSAVAIDGDLAAVGSRFDADNGTDSGSAYVYRFDGSAWPQEQKMLAADGAADDSFGRAIAVSGDFIVAGAPRHDHNGVDSGSAYVFHFNGTSWQQQQELMASDGAAQDNFGYAVAIEGQTLVVGARADDGLTGSAYVFVYNGSTWDEQYKLVASDRQSGDWFGTSLSISGNTVLVGAYGDDDQASQAGSAYVFQYQAPNWVEQAKLVAADGAANDFFGWAVALSGDAALCGAYADDDNGNTSGSAYVFRRSGSVWTFEQKLLASDGSVNQIFGKAVSLSGDIALIAAHRDGDLGIYAGAAYVFRFSNAVWVEEKKLLASDGEVNDRLGWSLAVSGDTAVIGANRDDDMANDAGAAYIFGGLSDCNGNDVLDFCDVADGVSLDCNANGAPDECEYPGCAGILPADLNCDGLANGADVQRFADTLIGGGYTCQTDMNQDGTLDMIDLPLFISALLAP